MQYHELWSLFIFLYYILKVHLWSWYFMLLIKDLAVFLHNLTIDIGFSRLKGGWIVVLKRLKIILNAIKVQLSVRARIWSVPNLIDRSNTAFRWRLMFYSLFARISVKLISLVVKFWWDLDVLKSSCDRWWVVPSYIFLNFKRCQICSRQELFFLQLLKLD